MGMSSRGSIYKSKYALSNFAKLDKSMGLYNIYFAKSFSKTVIRHECFLKGEPRGV